MAIRTMLGAVAARATRRPGGNRFGFLLAMLMGSYVVSAFISGPVVRILQIALFFTVVLLAVRASRMPRRIARLASAVIVAGSAAALALTAASTAALADGAAFAWVTLMLLFAVILIIREVLSHPEVTAQSIFGAVSAYMIIGLTFASGYAAMSKLIGGPFFANGKPGSAAAFQYFSFATLTTVGYGDYTAAQASGRALAVMEALLGQVFLATLVARLVSAYRSPQRRRRERAAPQSRQRGARPRPRRPAPGDRARSGRPARGRPG
jgi:hypothetical protein